MARENFADRLFRKVKEKGTPLVVGLDPRLELIPEVITRRFIEEHGRTLRSAVDSVALFCCDVIDCVAPLVAAIKPQLAFIELLGPSGMQVFFDICRYAHEKGLLVIADAKRGDIETTASAYARGFLGEVEIFGSTYPIWDVDAITINPYLGSDSVKPFLQEAAERGKGIFVVVKTSNPGGAEIQDLQVDGEPLFLRVGRLVKEWGRGMIGESGFSSVGAVVGATYPQEMASLRRLLPESPFLIPGLGFQGATSRDISCAFNRQGLGGLVAAARSIIFAHCEEPWKDKFPPEHWTEAVMASTHHTIGEIRRALAEPNREVVF